MPRWLRALVHYVGDHSAIVAGLRNLFAMPDLAPDCRQLGELPRDLRTLVVGGLAYPRSPNWPKIRAAHIKANPTCAACGTREDPEAHHIEPFHLFRFKELDPANLLTLCGENANGCHRRVGHGWNWQCWCPDAVAEAARQLAYFAARRES